MPHILSGRVPIRCAVDAPDLAVSCLAQCLDRDAATSVLDSVLRTGLMTPRDLAGALQRVGPRGLKLAALVSPCSESGIESILRLLLRSMRVKFQTQVVIREVGRVDFLIGDRLVVEADGILFHSGDHVKRDRARDLALERLGFRCLRFTYDDIMHRPHEVRSLIRAVMARKEHLWSSRTRVWDRDPVLGHATTAVEEAWRVCQGELSELHAQRAIPSHMRA